MREEQALIAEAMQHATTPNQVAAFNIPLSAAPPRSVETGTPRVPPAAVQASRNSVQARDSGDNDGPYWTTHSEKWAPIEAGRAAPRAFIRIPDEFNEIRVRAFVLNPCNGDVPVCGGGTVQLRWRGKLVDLFNVTSGYAETKAWTLGRDSYTGGGFEVRFDFIGAGDYEIEGRY